MADSSAKVPAIVATGIICLALGVAVGILGATFFGYHVIQPGPSGAAAGGGEGGPTAGGPGMPGGPGGPGGGMPKGGGGGMRGPSPKMQLISLVSKLDVLSEKPLAVKLTDEQKKKVAEQLQGLEAKEELSDEDAKKRLDALLEVVKDQKDSLESAGYRWPGQGGFQRPPDAPNPFKLEKNAKSLKTLQDRVAAPAKK